MKRRALALSSAIALVAFACSDGDTSRLDDGRTIAPSPAGAIDDVPADGARPAPPVDGVAVGEDDDEDDHLDAGLEAEAEAPKRVASPVPGRVVTYPFGVKNSSYAAGYHTGDDYAAPSGSDVVAVRSGTIRWSNDNGGAYGKWMGLDADNGRTYVYCHLSARALGVGAKVEAGQVIGKVGSTGNSTGPHLHFEDHPLGPFVYGQVRKPAW